MCSLFFFINYKETTNTIYRYGIIICLDTVWPGHPDRPDPCENHRTSTKTSRKLPNLFRFCLTIYICLIYLLSLSLSL